MRNTSSKSSEEILEQLETIREGKGDVNEVIKGLEQHEFFNLNNETLEAINDVRASIEDLLGTDEIINRDDIVEHEAEDSLEKLLAILKGHEEEKGTEEEFLLRLSSLNSDNEEEKIKLQHLFAIQKIDPKTISDASAQSLLKTLQGEHQSFLNFLEFKKLAESTDYGEKKSLTKKILQSIKEWESSYQHFEQEILPKLSDEIVKKYKEDSGITEREAKADKEAEEGEKRVADETAKKTADQKAQEEVKETEKVKRKADREAAEEKAKTERETSRQERRAEREDEELEKEEGFSGLIYRTRNKLSEMWHGESERLDERTEDILIERLSNPKQISHLDPTCAVIDDMLMEMEEDELVELENFLKNPNKLIEISAEDEAAIDALKKERGTKDLPNLLKKLQTEFKQADRRLNRYGGKLNSKVFEAAEEARVEVDTLEIQVQQTEELIQKRSKNFLYKSPRHILAMIYYFNHKDDVNAIRPEEMEKKLDKEVHTKREKLYGGAFKWVNRAGSALLFKPTMESNLRALAEDEDFKTLGEKPAEKLAELAKRNKTEYSDVNNWVKSLNGGIEKHANSTVARLIAYLELTMRDGNTNRLTRTGRTKKLVDHLKKVQRSYVEEEVGKETYENDQEKTLAFIKKLNESNRYTADLSKKILRNNAVKAGAVTSAVGTSLSLGAGAITMGILPGMSWLASIPAGAAAGTLMGSKHIPDKHRDAAKKIAKRTLFGTAALTAGLALPGMLGLLGFGVAGATVLASPNARKWLVEHKGGMGKVAGGAARATWLTGKYTIGLPLVILNRMFRAV